MATAAREHASFVEHSHLPLLVDAADLALPPTPSAEQLERWVNLEPAKEPALSFEGIFAAEFLENGYELYYDLLLRCAAASTKLFASTGKRLPSVSAQLVEKIYWSQTETGLGQLARDAEISHVTGCWSVPDAYRTDKGYAMTWNAERYGLKRGEGEYKGMQLHQAAFLLKELIDNPEYKFPAGHDRDHNCRFTGCANPNHLEAIPKLENNKRKDHAHPLEAALFAGQLMIGGTGHAEIDELAMLSPNEDTGIVINARFGPHRLIKVDESPLVVRGEPEADELLTKVRPPATGKKQPSGKDLTKILNGQLPLPKPKRKSRASSPKIFEGQQSMFAPTKYKKAAPKKPTKKVNAHA